MKTLTAIIVLLLGCVASVALGASWTDSTVLVRADDHGPNVNSLTTGTVLGVDRANDTALILTCAHSFSDSGGMNSGVGIQLYGNPPVVLRDAKVTLYDTQNDIALVKVNLQGHQVTSAPIAAQQARVGEPVISVGCSNGAPPTALQTQIASLDKYDDGRSVTVVGTSAQGRSGGPLFNARGEVLGVLSAADNHESFYCSLPALHNAIAGANLTKSVSYTRQRPSRARQTQYANMDNVVYEDGQTCAPCGDTVGQLPAEFNRVIDQQVVIDERIREPIRRYDDAMVDERIAFDRLPPRDWPVPRERFVTPEIQIREWNIRGVAAQRLIDRWAAVERDPYIGSREREWQLQEILRQLRAIREVQRSGLVPRVEAY